MSGSILGERFDEAVLINGEVLWKVEVVRAEGYDTRLFVTNGKTLAPIDAVLKLVNH